MNPYEQFGYAGQLPMKGNPYAEDVGVVPMNEQDVFQAIGGNPYERFGLANQEKFGPQRAEYSRQFGSTKPDKFKNFAERVGEDMTKRAEMGLEIDAARKSGQQGYIESGFQKAGKVGAGLVNDVLTESIVSGARGASFLMPTLAGTTKNVGVHLNNSSPVRAAMGVAQKAVQKYGDFAEEHPRLARNIESATNLGLMYGAGKTPPGQAATDTAVAVGQKGLDVAGDAATALNTKKAIPTVQAVSDKSRSLFKSGLNKGASFTDDAADELINVVQRERTSDPFAAAALGANEMDDVAKRLTEARKNPMTLDSYEALDKEWGSLGHQATIAGKDNLARQYDVLQEKLREIAQNPQFVKGPQGGIDDYQKAVKLWAVKSKMRDIEQINEYAKYYVGGEASGIKAGYARLAKSNKLYKFSPKEAKMIKKAAQTGNVEGLMRTLGSRLMVIGGAVKGGPVGAAAAYAASQGMRGGAAALKGVESSRIGKSIAKEAVKISPDLATTSQRIPIDKMKQIMKLPPKQAKAALAELQEMKMLPAPAKEYAAGSQGVAVRSAEDVARSNAARTERAALGLTPDVQRVVTKAELRNKFGSVWDEISQTQQNEIKKQVDAAWQQNKMPIEDIISEAKKRAEALAAETGIKPGGLVEALSRAKPLKRK